MFRKFPLMSEMEELMRKGNSSEGNTPEGLRAAYDALNARHEFKAGDLVKITEVLRNRLYPGGENPAIVMEIISPPIISQEDDSGANNFHEPLDMIIGVMIDGQFNCFHVDSRRFEPYVATEEAKPATD